MSAVFEWFDLKINFSVVEADFSTTIHPTENGSFGPYEIPVLLSVDIKQEKYHKAAFVQKYPTLTFQMGKNHFFHRFKNFKELSSRPRKSYRRFRGFPAVCCSCPYRVNLAPIFTIDMGDPRFRMVENWKIIPPTREPKYPIHTCHTDIHGIALRENQSDLESSTLAIQSHPISQSFEVSLQPHDPEMNPLSQPLNFKTFTA